MKRIIIATVLTLALVLGAFGLLSTPQRDLSTARAEDLRNVQVGDKLGVVGTQGNPTLLLHPNGFELIVIEFYDGRYLVTGRHNPGDGSYYLAVKDGDQYEYISKKANKDDLSWPETVDFADGIVAYIRDPAIQPMIRVSISSPAYLRGVDVGDVLYDVFFVDDAPNLSVTGRFMTFGDGSYISGYEDWDYGMTILEHGAVKLNDYEGWFYKTYNFGGRIVESIEQPTILNCIKILIPTTPEGIKVGDTLDYISFDQVDIASEFDWTNVPVGGQHDALIFADGTCIKLHRSPPTDNGDGVIRYYYTIRIHTAAGPVFTVSRSDDGVLTWYLESWNFEGAVVQSIPIPEILDIMTIDTELAHTVTFYDYTGELHSYVNVADGATITGPEMTRPGYTFAGWSESLSNITSDLDVYPVFEIAPNLRPVAAGDVLGELPVYGTLEEFQGLTYNEDGSPHIMLTFVGGGYIATQIYDASMRLIVYYDPYRDNSYNIVRIYADYMEITNNPRDWLYTVLSDAVVTNILDDDIGLIIKLPDSTSPALPFVGTPLNYVSLGELDISGMDISFPKWTTGTIDDFFADYPSEYKIIELGSSYIAGCRWKNSDQNILFFYHYWSPDDYSFMPLSYIDEDGTVTWERSYFDFGNLTITQVNISEFLECFVVLDNNCTININFDVDVKINATSLNKETDYLTFYFNPHSYAQNMTFLILPLADVEYTATLGLDGKLLMSFPDGLAIPCPEVVADLMRDNIHYFYAGINKPKGPTTSFPADGQNVLIYYDTAQQINSRTFTADTGLYEYSVTYPGTVTLYYYALTANVNKTYYLLSTEAEIGEINTDLRLSVSNGKTSVSIRVYADIVGDYKRSGVLGLGGLYYEITIKSISASINKYQYQFLRDNEDDIERMYFVVGQYPWLYTEVPSLLNKPYNTNFPLTVRVQEGIFTDLPTESTATWADPPANNSIWDWSGIKGFVDDAMSGLGKGIFQVFIFLLLIALGWSIVKSAFRGRR